MMRFLVISAVVLSSMLMGCRRDADAGDRHQYGIATPGLIITNAQIKVGLDDLRNEDVLVCVSNRCYRKSDFLADRRIALDMLAKAMPDPNARAKKLQEILPGMPWRFTSDFVSRTVYALEGLERGIVPSTNEVALARRPHAHVCKILGIDFDEYASRYHGGVARLNDKIADEARNKMLFQSLFTNSLQVTDADIAKIRSELEEANKSVAASNAILRVNFQRQCDKIKRNELDISEEVDAGMLPEGLEVDHFEGVVADYFDDDAKLLVELQSLPKGGWTDIRETEEEFAIYTISRFTPRNFQAPDFYSGIKVSVKKDLGYLVPDVQRARKDLRYIKNQTIVVPKTQELAQKFGVAFPNGTYWADQPLRAPRQKPVNSK